MMARFGRTAAGVCVGLVMALSAGLDPVGAGGNAQDTTLADIEAKAGVGAVPADYVIMADTSGSMTVGNLYEPLKQALRGFFAAIAPTDHVSLIRFDERAEVVFDGPAGRSPDELVGKLPGTAVGGKTDIGAAIERALERLSRQNAASIATVVLVTDGAHQPPTGSAYPFGTGYSWDELARKARELKKGSLRAYALPLAGGVNGAALLSTVFSGTTMLDAAQVSDITQRLEQPKREARAAKVKAALGTDPSGTVDVVWPQGFGQLSPGENRLSVTLTSRLQRMPVTLDRFGISQSEGPPLRARVESGALTLEPGASATVPVVLDWPAGDRGWSFSDPVTTSGRLALTAENSSPWAKVLASELGLTIAPKLGTAETQFAGSGNLGRPWAWYGGSGLLLALLIVIGVYLYLTPRLLGELVVVAPPPFPSARRIDLRRHGRGAVLSAAQTGQQQVKVRMVRGKQGMRLGLLERGRAGAKERVLRPGDEITLSSIVYGWKTSPEAAASLPSTLAYPSAAPKSPAPTLQAPTLQAPTLPAPTLQAPKPQAPTLPAPAQTVSAASPPPPARIVKPVGSEPPRSEVEVVSEPDEPIARLD